MLYWCWKFSAKSFLINPCRIMPFSIQTKFCHYFASPLPKFLFYSTIMHTWLSGIFRTSCFIREELQKTQNMQYFSNQIVWNVYLYFTECLVWIDWIAILFFYVNFFILAIKKSKRILNISFVSIRLKKNLGLFSVRKHSKKMLIISSEKLPDIKVWTKKMPLVDFS